MNAIQIYREVAALLSQGVVESKEAFRASLNRALAEVGRIRPLVRFLTLRHYPSPAVFRLSAPRVVEEDAPLTVSAFSCGAFALTGSGEGELWIYSDENELAHVVLSGQNGFCYTKTAKELLDHNTAQLTLLFGSKSQLRLESLILYGRHTEKTVLPDSEYRSYEVSALTNDFLAFGTEVKKDRILMQKGQSEVVLAGNTVKIKSDKSGLYEIGYWALPTPVEESRESEEISLDAELNELLLLLCAYYVALEAADERAEAFLERYRNALANHRQAHGVSLSCEVQDCNGW